MVRDKGDHLHGGCHGRLPPPGRIPLGELDIGDSPKCDGLPKEARHLTAAAYVIRDGRKG